MTEFNPDPRPSSVGRTVVSRRLFLKGTGGIALAGALAPLLFEGHHGDLVGVADS
jgi:TAT (twin-arginine translocation) pathway signal sequence